MLVPMRIAVLTSGGDAPGMNAAIRSIALAGAQRGHQVLGVRHGYDGLLAGDAQPFAVGATDGITSLGGTILGSARCAAFTTVEGRARACARLRELGVDVLVVIGGNGSLTGAHLLAHEGSCRVVGLPASIDNDIGHTGMAIGVDTAVNTIVDACDRISDTARAHRRAFIVEVMGRRCGFLAMRAGIAAEADVVLYGERQPPEDQVIERLRGVLRRCFSPQRGKRRVLIVKSEGVDIPTHRIVERLRAHVAEDAPGADIRETILGHLVRGGHPSALDRSIALRLGFEAVLAAEHGMSDVMLGWDVPPEVGAATPDPSVRAVPLDEVLLETGRLLDGTSPVVAKRIELLTMVEDLLAM
jgi:6-phosphofructokinase 1